MTTTQQYDPNEPITTWIDPDEVLTDTQWGRCTGLTWLRKEQNRVNISKKYPCVHIIEDCAGKLALSRSEHVEEADVDRLEALVWRCTKEVMPKEGQPVETLIKDDLCEGERNAVVLKRKGSTWWYRNGKEFVYYTPTHWRPIRRVLAT